MRGWLRKRGWGIAVGLAVTLLTVVAYLAGRLKPLEYAHLDYCFRHVNAVPADPQIVMIDINDVALQRIHRWPWPRRLQATLVGLLDECGAEAILLDLVYAEPTPARVVHPALEPEHEFDPPRVVLGDVTLQDAVRDDEELARAIERAGNVYVAAYFPLSPPEVKPAEVWERARRVLDKQPGTSLEEFVREVRPPEGTDVETLHLRARIDGLLRAEFSLTAEEVAERLGVAKERVEELVAGAKELAARSVVEAFVGTHPRAPFSEIVAEILPGQAEDLITPDRSELLRAYRHVLALHATLRHALNEPERFEGVIPNGSDLTLPIPSIAAAARRVGFVNFEKDEDGVLRHVPPLANVEGSVLMQIAFAMAADVLDMDLDTVKPAENGALHISDGKGRNHWEIPLNERGEMLINWHIDHAHPDWTRSFAHVPAARVMEVALNRRAIRENENRMKLLRAEAVALRYGGAASGYLDYERLIRQWEKPVPRLMPQPRWHVPDPSEVSERRALKERIDRVEADALGYLQSLHQQIQGLEPESAEEAAEFRRIADLHSKLIDPEYGRRLRANNKLLRQRNKMLTEELTSRIRGKLCFVGHTAAAQADIVNSPVYENMPGVLAHANLVNTLLTGRIPRMAGKPANVAIIVATGVLVTLLASSRGPWLTFLCVIGVMALSLASSSWVMSDSGIYVAAAVPASGVFVTWAMITAYRQLTEERQRRSLARVLARTTSPAIAERITERLDDLDLSPQPAEVTCYFSDLEGFTTISERLGIDQTQRILNHYLGAMGEVLLRHKAFNKFMGDGIFAFFNAPVWPEPDHVRVGIEAALATVDRLAELKAETGMEHAEEVRRLRMRIGLHTGPVFVGEFGSEDQTDYTCIGDTVNLAARLEPANKVFGTHLIVSGACRDAAPEGYAFRYLGYLQVKGKALAVPIHELLGRAGAVDDGVLGYAREFGAAVELFQAREWEAARGAFEDCLHARPEDVAAKQYLAEIERRLITPPPDDWNKAIELTTK